MLSAAAATALAGPPLWLPPPAAAAVGLPPLQPAARALTSGPRSSLQLAEAQLLPLLPGPVAFPRRQLDLTFAVLQLRSGYEALDDLDFVAMNEYQKKFWKLRQAEWEPYLLLHAPLRIKQGDLTSPLYFDFITFSQAASAGLAMKEGRQVFEEYGEETEEVGVVERDPALADNALLPAWFFEREGDRLYRGLVEGFRGVSFGGPPPCAPGASASELLQGVQQLLDIYVDKGYALKATLNPGGGGGQRATLSPVGDGAVSGSIASGLGASGGAGSGASFEVKLEGPANLWSLQALAARRSTLFNDHPAAAIAAFLRASGRGSTCRLGWSDTGVTQQWTLD